MKHEEKQKFSITIPEGHRESVKAALAEVPHVTPPTINTPGRFSPPDGQGLEFSFVEDLSKPGRVEFTVEKTPDGKPLSERSLGYCEGRIASDIQHRFAAMRGKV